MNEVARRDNRYAARLDAQLDAVVHELGCADRFETNVSDLSLTGIGFMTGFCFNIDHLVARYRKDR